MKNGLYDVLVSSSINDDIKQHVSNHFLEDCKIGTSPEKMYSVDGFRKSVIVSNVQDCSEIARGTYVHCEVRKTKRSAVLAF